MGDNYDATNRQVLSYERLTNLKDGPMEAMRVSEFLSRSDGVTTVAPEEEPCVWYGVVMYKKLFKSQGSNLAQRRRLQQQPMGDKIQNDQQQQQEQEQEQKQKQKQKQKQEHQRPPEHPTI